nr:hypothetical protein [Tanacetum cinerariifolium]
MRSFDSSSEITNSFICIFPRVKFPFYDPVVHYSGHDIKRILKVNAGFFDIQMPNVAWYLKVEGASSRDDGESLSFRMISINITSPSSSLLQTNLALGDGGTDSSDSKSELNLRNFLVRNEIDRSSGVEELEWLFRAVSLFFLIFFGLLSWESLRSLGWIVMVTKLTTGRLVNGSSCDGIDMVIKKLDLKPKDIVVEFCGPSRWKELSKESGEQPKMDKGQSSSYKELKLGNYKPMGVTQSTWMAFGGTTHNLGSFGEETDEITGLHQILEEVLLTVRGDGVAGLTRHRRDPSSDGVRDLVTASGRCRLNEDLESST